jgi:hypothetical protein
MAMVETKSFPLTDQTGMITIKNVDAGYLGFAVPYFMQLGKYFDKKLELNKLKIKYGYGSGHYSPLKEEIIVSAFDDFNINLDDILSTKESIEIRKRDPKMHRHKDKYIGIFHKRYESCEKFPKTLENFNTYALHELTHKYFEDVILSEKKYKKLKVKLYRKMVRFEKKKGIAVYDFLNKIKSDQTLPKNWTEDTVSFIGSVSESIEYARSKLPRGIRKTYKKYIKIGELNENLARAHVLAKLDVFENYDADWTVIVEYMINRDYDIRIGNLEIKRLSRKIQKTGLRSTMETEYQKIMGKPSKKVAT